MEPNYGKAINAFRIAEKTAFGRAGAYIAFRAKDGKTETITIRVAYPKDGAGTLRVWVWGGTELCHYGIARGYGYDKLSAALEGVEFGYGIPPLQGIAGVGDSAWKAPLQDAGFTVVTAL